MAISRSVSPHCRRESFRDRLARTHAAQFDPIAVVRDEIQNGVAPTLGYERVGLEWPAALLAATITSFERQ